MCSLLNSNQKHTHIPLCHGQVMDRRCNSQTIAPYIIFKTKSCECRYRTGWAYLLCVDVDCLKEGYGSINWTPELSICMMKLRAEQINLASLLHFDLFNRFSKRHLESHRGSSSVLHPPTHPPWDTLSLLHALYGCRRTCEHNFRVSSSLRHSAELGSFIWLVLRIEDHDSTSDPFGGKIWSGISFQGLGLRSVKSSFCGCPLEVLTRVSTSHSFHLSLAINMSPCWGETQSGIKFTAYKI